MKETGETLHSNAPNESQAHYLHVESDSLRSYLRVNMLDGDEGGTLTMAADRFLDEVCGLVGEWLSQGSRDLPEIVHRAHVASDEGTGYCPLAEQATRERDRALAAIERVRGLHKPMTADGAPPRCARDALLWPCPTIRAIEPPDAERPPAGVLR